MTNLQFDYEKAIADINQINTRLFELDALTAANSHERSILMRNLKKLTRLASELAEELGTQSVTVQPIEEPRSPAKIALGVIGFSLVAAVALLAVGLFAPQSPAEAVEVQSTVQPEETAVIESSQAVEDAVEEVTVAPSHDLAPEAYWTGEEAKDRFVRAVSSRNPKLAECADQMVQHPRWVEALAIAGQETTWGTNIKSNVNNIGNIQSGRKDRRWKAYANICNGLEDIAILIENDRYRDMTIDQMNGTYCVDEVVGYGPCPHWGINIMNFVNEIRSM